MEKPTFKDALKFWIKLGLISFGGPAGQISIMHEYLVVKKKWISDSRFMHALNYCMILPGPEAQQLATYSGWLLHGVWGGLAAGTLFILPAMFLLLGMSILYVTFGNIPWIYALFTGLKPAVVAIIVLALIKIGKKALLSAFHYIVAICAFIGIFIFHIPFQVIIIGTIVLAVVCLLFFPNVFQNKDNDASKNNIDESEYYINNTVTDTKSKLSPAQALAKMAISIVLWCAPVVLLYTFSAQFEFWKEITLFFTQAAFITFGGAYSVLPYVAQESVEKYHWLTNLQMMDGLALGETTPGPLIIILSFVGFMAGYHHYDMSVIMGTLALLVTTYYTFLPSFTFIFIGAPIIEKTQQNKWVKKILSLVTAAVVGVVLNLAFYLASAVLLSDQATFMLVNWAALGWILVSIWAMYYLQIGMIKWIGVSMLFGIASYLIPLLLV